MNINELLSVKNGEKPLDTMVENGGFCGIFRGLERAACGAGVYRCAMGGHLTLAGYLLTARMTESYIDYIIRANYKDFAQVGFIGTGFYNKNEKPLQ